MSSIIKKKKKKSANRNRSIDTQILELADKNFITITIKVIISIFRDKGKEERSVKGKE